MHAAAANNKPKIHHHSFACCFVSFHFFSCKILRTSVRISFRVFSFRCFLFCYYSPEMLPFLHFKLLWFHCSCIRDRQTFSCVYKFLFSRSAQRSAFIKHWNSLETMVKETNERPQTNNGTKLHKSQNIRKYQLYTMQVLWLFASRLFRFVFFFFWSGGCKEHILYFHT